MLEQNMKLVRSTYSPRSSWGVKAAQVGLVGTDEADEGKYRRFTTRSDRDLTPMAYNDVRKKSFYLWQRNKLFKRLIDLMVDFCVGEETKVTVRKMKRTSTGDEALTDDLEGQQTWDDFFEDPQNDLEDDLGPIFTDYLINGEVIMPANVNDTDGKVWLGYLDPMYIVPVKYGDDGNPSGGGIVSLQGDIRKVDKIVLSLPNSTETKTFTVIRFNRDGNPDTNESYGKLKGEVFFFQLNKLPTQLRGYSILMTDIDWCDAFDQFLFGALDGFDARNDYFFDCSLEGLTEEDLKTKKVSRPNRGEVNLHNEKAKWDVIKPDLGSQDIATAATLLETFIVGTNGFPRHWFGDGDTTNRATADAMSIPTKKMLKRIQKYLRRILKIMAAYVLQCAVDKRKIKLAADEYYDVQVSMYNLDQKEIDTAGSGFTQLVNAMKIAVSSGWATDETAKKFVDGALQSYGIDVDTSQTVEQIKEANKQNEQQRTGTDIANQAPDMFEFLRSQRKKAGVGEFENQQQQQKKGLERNANV